MRSRWCVASPAAHDANPCACWVIAATTMTGTGGCYERGGSGQWSPVAASRMAPDWARTAGRWSARSPGCTSSAGCASAGSTAPTFTVGSGARLLPDLLALPARRHLNEQPPAHPTACPDHAPGGDVRLLETLA